MWVWDAATGELVRMYDERVMDDPEVRHVLEKNRYNVPPASHLPVILGIGESSKVDVARWGFPIPKRPNGVFNTKIETAKDSPLWRGLIGESHCLFLVKGFYEWKNEGKRKVPHFIHRRDRRPMLLAGVFAKGRGGAESKWLASIVTCAPTRQMAEIHDRMPVVIEEVDAADWLHPRSSGMGRVLELAAPGGDVLDSHAVGAAANDTGNDTPALIEPVRHTKLF
ncbi:MAG: SOS response-associated peptidase [Euryarchaeota archaeon]|nr:SOS response-associated peptidase [Euryarchaeota archaeon]